MGWGGTTFFYHQQKKKRSLVRKTTRNEFKSGERGKGGIIGEGGTGGKRVRKTQLRQGGEKGTGGSMRVAPTPTKRKNQKSTLLKIKRTQLFGKRFVRDHNSQSRKSNREREGREGKMAPEK